MSSSGKKEVPCGLCPGRGHWITHNRRPVFVHLGGPCKSDLPRLARFSYRGGYQSFTHPTKCGFCGCACFLFQNENGSKVFFDSLGPPWFKHSCNGAPRESALPDWKSQGYTPLHLLEAIPDSKRQVLRFQVELLPSGRRLALRLEKRKDIPAVRTVIANPIHVKPLSTSEEKWELSTFELVGEAVRPKNFDCERTPYQESLW